MAQRAARNTIVVTLLLIASGSSNAHAQAWVGEKGGLDVSLDYNFATSSNVVWGTPPAGERKYVCEDCGTTSHQVTLGAEYVPVRNLSVMASLPLNVLKYTGTGVEHLGGGHYDDGAMHTTLTDLRAGVRYQLLEEPFVLSPQLAVSIPVANYETVGNAVPGRHLKALHLGLAVGKELGDAGYVQASYEFSFVERYDRTIQTARFGQNRTDVSLVVGYKLLQHRLDINLGANARVTHGGIEFSDFGNGTLTPQDELYHDPILKEDIFLVGAGLGYQITNTVSASLALRYFLGGHNTQDASVLGLGLAWSVL